MAHNELYTDLKSPGLIRTRKIDYYSSIILVIIILSLYIFFIVFPPEKWEKQSIDENILTVIIGIIGVVVLSFGLIYIFIKDSKKALRYGIIVDKDNLFWYGEIIPIELISKAEILMFHPNPKKIFSIWYSYEKKRKSKRSFHYVIEKGTDNIFSLNDIIRKLKGWDKQTSINSYDFLAWRKASLGKSNDLHVKCAPEPIHSQ